jgi:serine/threonine protein kinase
MVGLMTARRLTPVKHTAPGQGPAQGWHVGQLIDDRYEIVELLSSGAMARVCRVRHRVLGRTLALKALRAEWSRDHDSVRRLLREARALASLEHPNIISVLDCGWLPSGEPYFVMEYAEGVSLERWMSEGPVDADVAVEVAAGICDALDAAHRLGIVHRDLKPENVWVDRRAGLCAVKVLDFGLAQVSGQERLTRPSVAHGTAEYMSPEQAAGETIDARSDLYALGVMLYEMLCGRLPFDADAYVGLAHQHRYAPVPPFRRWLPPSSGAFKLEPLIRRCLEKAPALRFESAAQLGFALAPFRAKGKTLRLPGLARKQPPAKPLSLQRKRGFWGTRPLRARRATGRLSYATLLLWVVIGAFAGGLLSRLAF